MIRRLLTIKDAGNWQTFKWDTTTPDFARINVIYGGNGAGKTSLSEALRELSKDPEAAERITLEVEANGQRKPTSALDNSLFDSIFVFNEHFVEKAHKLSKESADMQAVLTVGERTVEAEAELEKLRPLLEGASEEHASLLKKKDGPPRQLDTKYKDISEQVVRILSKADARYASRGKYSRGTVKALFDGPDDRWSELDEATLATRVTTAQTTNRDPLKVGEFAVAIEEGVASRIKAALAKSPVSVILDSLAAHANATNWVDEGRALHEDLSECIFCGGALSEVRKSDIENHFSDEVGDLQNDIDDLVAELDEIDLKVTGAQQMIVASALLFEDLRDKHTKAKTAFETKASDLTDWISAARERLKSKRENVLLVDDKELPSAPTLDDADLTEIYAEHDTRVSAHERLVQEAARAVEEHYLKVAAEGVGELKQQMADDETEENRLRDRVKELRAKIASLESVDGDPLPSAQALTNRVAQLLGRTELAFELRDNRYVVTRRGEPAHGLSVGERTAITLVHFLELVRQFKSTTGGPIVVIDDPVSSLDSNIFMGISTMIWTEALSKTHIAQLVLLTHNFELFRQWDIQLTRRPKLNRQLFPAAQYEIKSRHEERAGKISRVPSLSAWPPSEPVRDKMRSSYHHGVLMLVDAKRSLESDDSLEARLDAQMLFPNVLRRTLETFLAFKLPKLVGNFNGSMAEAGEMLKGSSYPGDVDVLQNRLTRYTHAHSHSDTPITNSIVSPDEVRTAIGAAFTFMYYIDKGHLEGICEVLELESSSIMADESDFT